MLPQQPQPFPWEYLNWETRTEDQAGATLKSLAQNRRPNTRWNVAGIFFWQGDENSSYPSESLILLTLLLGSVQGHHFTPTTAVSLEAELNLSWEETVRPLGDGWTPPWVRLKRNERRFGSRTVQVVQSYTNNNWILKNSFPTLALSNLISRPVHSMQSFGR